MYIANIVALIYLPHDLPQLLRLRIYLGEQLQPEKLRQTVPVYKLEPVQTIMNFTSGGSHPLPIPLLDIIFASVFLFTKFDGL